MKEYHVSSVQVRDVQAVLNNYSKQGWVLKFAFDVGYGVTELIFERDKQDA